MLFTRTEDGNQPSAMLMHIYMRTLNNMCCPFFKYILKLESEGAVLFCRLLCHCGLRPSSRVRRRPRLSQNPRPPTASLGRTADRFTRSHSHWLTCFTSQLRRSTSCGRSLQVQQLLILPAGRRRRGQEARWTVAWA